MTHTRDKQTSSLFMSVLMPLGIKPFFSGDPSLKGRRCSRAPFDSIASLRILLVGFFSS